MNLVWNRIPLCEDNDQLAAVEYCSSRDLRNKLVSLIYETVADEANYVDDQYLSQSSALVAHPQ